MASTKWILIALGALALAGALVFVVGESRPTSEPQVSDSVQLSPEPTVEEKAGALSSQEFIEQNAEQLQQDWAEGEVETQLSLTPHTTPRFQNVETQVRDLGDLQDNPNLRQPGSIAVAPPNVGANASSNPGGMVGGHPMANPQNTAPVTGDGPLGPNPVMGDQGLPGPGGGAAIDTGAPEGSTAPVNELPGPQGQQSETDGATAPGSGPEGDGQVDSDLIGPAEGPGGSLENKPPGG